MSNLSNSVEQNLVGRQPLRLQLANILNNDGLRVIILAGAAGSGKHTCALAVANKLLCTSESTSGEIAGCGECPSCVYLRNCSHPDFLDIQPRANEKTIKTEVIRNEVCNTMHLSSRLGGKRVFVIAGDYLNETSQNVLLKSLEEIPPQTYVIITSSNPNQLLITLRSRAVKIEMPILTIEEMREILIKHGYNVVDGKADYVDKNISTVYFNFLNDFTKNNPGKILNYLAMENFPNIEHDVISLFADITELGYGQLINKYALLWQDKDWQLQFELMTYFLEVIIKYTKLEHLIKDNKDVNLLINNIRTEKFSVQKISNILKYIAETKYALNNNVNFEIAVTRLLLQMRKEIVDA